MIHETHLLKELFPGRLSTGQEPTLTSYLHVNVPEIEIDRVRPALIVCPGGGYTFLSEREAEPVALKFFEAGFQVFILRYSLAPEKYPTQLIELAAAVAHIRAKAGVYGIDPDQIAISGFSAGAHLCANLSVQWQLPVVADALGIDSALCRPNAAVLAYAPATTEISRPELWTRLLGEGYREADLHMLSFDQWVSEKTPPTFLSHTFADELVDVRHANALADHQIPFELHVFPTGIHGLSLANLSTTSYTEPKMLNAHAAHWADLCVEWLKELFGFLL